MRKISSLVLSSILGISILSGCGSQSTGFAPLQTIAPQQTVSAQSTQGLNVFIDVIVKNAFYMIDRNKDGFVTYPEFAPQDMHPIPAPLPPEPVAPGPTTQARASASLQALPDEKTRFARLDINRDGKLSPAEVKKNPRYFLGVDKTQYRNTVKIAFDSADSNKNNSISQQEYSVFLTNVPYEAQFFLYSIFNTSDVNKNGSLSFSEYEDLYYGQMQAYIETPKPVPVQSGTPSGDPYGDPGYGSDPAPVYGEPAPGSVNYKK